MCSARKNLLGLKYGRLTPIEYICGSKGVIGGWICNCDCGKTSFVATRHLTSGSTKSCGCYASELTTRRNITHGNSFRGKRSGAYKTWIWMKLRCEYKKHDKYEYYGGRGITVCDRWLNFENFLKDMGARPHGHEIDRIDSDGNYEPDNCRWVNHFEQMMNMRNNVIIETPGGKMVASEAARKYGLNVKNIYRQVKCGIDPFRLWDGKTHE